MAASVTFDIIVLLVVLSISCQILAVINFEKRDCAAASDVYIWVKILLICVVN